MISNDHLSLWLKERLRLTAVCPKRLPLHVEQTAVTESAASDASADVRKRLSPREGAQPLLQHGERVVQQTALCYFEVQQNSFPGFYARHPVLLLYCFVAAMIGRPVWSTVAQ